MSEYQQPKARFQKESLGEDNMEERITPSDAERLVGYAINAVLQSLAHVFGEGHIVSGIEVTRTAEGFKVEVDLLDLATRTEWETEIVIRSNEYLPQPIGTVHGSEESARSPYRNAARLQRNTHLSVKEDDHT